MAQDSGRGLAGVVDGAEVEDGQGGHGGPGHQVDLGLGDHAQRPLGTHHHAGQVHRGVAAGHELVQVVAADPALDFSVGAFNLVLLLPGDAQDAPVDVAFQSAGAEAGFQLGGRQLAQVGVGTVGEDDVQFPGCGPGSCRR